MATRGSPLGRQVKPFFSMPSQSSAAPPWTGGLAVNGLLQEWVASSRHSGKAGRSCLVEVFVCGSHRPSYRDLLVTTGASGHAMPSFAAALRQTSCTSCAAGGGSAASTCSAQLGLVEMATPLSLSSGSTCCGGMGVLSTGLDPVRLAWRANL